MVPYDTCAQPRLRVFEEFRFLETKADARDTETNELRTKRWKMSPDTLVSGWRTRIRMRENPLQDQNARPFQICVLLFLNPGWNIVVREIIRSSSLGRVKRKIERKKKKIKGGNVIDERSRRNKAVPRKQNRRERGTKKWTDKANVEKKEKKRKKRKE